MLYNDEMVYPWLDDGAPSNLPAIAITTSEDLAAISTRVHWEFHDLVVAHNMIRSTLIKRSEAIQEKEKNSVKIVLSGDETEEFNRVKYLDRIRNEDLMAEQIMKTSARSVIINSWMLAERAMGESLSILNKEKKGISKEKADYAWPEFLAKFKAFGINLEALPGYENAKLCRIVNNAIKHHGKVSKEMSEAQQFIGMEGRNIRDVNISPQIMVTAASGFSVALIETVDKNISISKNP